MSTYPNHPAADLFPMLEGDDLADLAADIKANGLLEPIWLYQGSLLDGRNRLAACEMAGVPPQFREYGGDDPIGFALSVNLRRRHLTTGQRAMLAVDVEPLYATEAARRKAQAPGQPQGVKSLGADLHQETLLPSEESESENAKKPTTPSKREPRAADRAARTTSTSGRAVAQAKRVAKAAPDLAEKVKAGDIALDRAERIIRDREAEERRIKEAKKESALIAAGECLRVDLRHGDFREVLADLHDVDAIITDPPYPHEFIPLLADLRDWADEVLAPDGVLVVLMGQTYLPEVYRLLEGGRPYRWTGAYMTPGASYQSHARRLHSNWKPFIVYGGGPRFADVVTAGGADADAKNNHKWGQDYNAFHTIVERLTKRGQTVVDPFMGSGTTLLAAHALGRHAVGCDIDIEHVQTAKGRLS